MPFFHGTLFSVDKKEMLRYAGLPARGDFPVETIDRALLTAEALARPRGIWQRLFYNPETGMLGAGDSAFLLEGSSIRKHLSSSFAVIAMAVTVGGDIERESDAEFQKGNYTEGLLLDAAATALTEHSADQLNEFINAEARKSGQKTTWRFSPGYGDWPVTCQKNLCRIIGADKIGISVTDHFMLTPRKSVTAVIGLSTCTQKQAPARCNSCSLASCPFRSH